MGKTEATFETVMVVAGVKDPRSEFTDGRAVTLRALSATGAMLRAELHVQGPGAVAFVDALHEGMAVDCALTLRPVEGDAFAHQARAQLGGERGFRSRLEAAGMLRPASVALDAATGLANEQAAKLRREREAHEAFERAADDEQHAWTLFAACSLAGQRAHVQAGEVGDELLSDRAERDAEVLLERWRKRQTSPLQEQSRELTPEQRVRLEDAATAAREIERSVLAVRESLGASAPVSARIAAAEALEQIAWSAGNWARTVEELHAAVRT